MAEHDDKTRWERIIAVFDRSGKSQADILRGTDLDPATVSRAIRGDYYSSLTLKKIEDYLRSVDDA